MITLTMDGQQVSVPEGSTILDAAKQLSIEIPTLCYHPALEPYGACRVCTVEVRYDGRRRMVTACNYPVWEGIEVLTASERVLKHRRMIVEFELGRCSAVPALRKLADELGIDKSRFGEEKQKCILCGLCARVCWEMVGANAIAFVSRGVDRHISTAYDEPAGVCIGCGACAAICPTGAITLEDVRGRKVLHQELSLAPNKAIRVPLLQAVPNVPFIDETTCIHFKTGECQRCVEVCPKDAINHEMEEEYEEVEVGTILVATGYDVIDVSQMLRYGYGVYDNVVTGLEFELLSHAGGPTGGKILMANGEPPTSVAVLHCVGSRDTNYHKYCCRVCCMYLMKIAHLIREKAGAEVYEFYIDIRAGGKGYEEFYNRNLEEGVNFVRGKVAEVIGWPRSPDEEGKLVIQVEDTLLGEIRRIPVDMVILAAAVIPRADAHRLAQLLGIGCGIGGFFMERHPKLAPVQTVADGVFVAGACQYPKDIPDTVAQGAAAAGNMLALIDKGVFEIEPIVSVIDEDLCGGCKMCIAMCPYTAITYDEEKKVSVVEEALCKGCGSCVAACPSGAAQQQGYTDKQLRAELEGALSQSGA